MRARKRFGQHFLQPEWVRKVIDLMAPRPDDAFVEIGAGPGALTFELARRAGRVLAIEIDRDLTPELAERVEPHVVVVEADALTVDLVALVDQHVGPGACVRVAGNLPYNISAPIVLRLVRLWREHRRFIDATLMVQLEVAQRLLARPGGTDYGPLAVAVGLWADTALLTTIPPGAFRPPPKVRSALVKLTFRRAAVEIEDEQRFDRLVRGLFTHRRKTVANALRAMATRAGVSAESVTAAAGVDPSLRPQMLDLAALASLARALPADLPPSD